MEKPLRAQSLDTLLATPEGWRPVRWQDAAKTPFLTAAKAQLKAVAAQLGMVRGGFTVSVTPAGEMHPGAVSLLGERVHLKVTGRINHQATVTYRRVRHRKDYGGAPGFAHDVGTAADLLDPASFAEAIKRSLLLDWDSAGVPSDGERGSEWAA